MAGFEGNQLGLNDVFGREAAIAHAPRKDEADKRPPP